VELCNDVLMHDSLMNGIFHCASPLVLVTDWQNKTQNEKSGHEAGVCV
jgi:hypothetical protein